MSSSFWRTCLLRLLALTVFVGFLPLTSTVAATYTVTNLNDSGPGTLRDAITTANGTPADDEIVFDPGLNGTTTLTTGELTIANNGTLNIDGEQRITVSGNDTSRVFSINIGVNASLNGLTITQGNTVNDGGGIFNSGTVTITNSTISDNSAFDGGGIATFFLGTGTVTITNSTISDNSAFASGGIANSGRTNLMITNSTISDNSSAEGAGGIGNGGTLMITNSTISSNSGGDNGGGILNFGTVTITNSTISDNSVLNGGGIDNLIGGR